MSSGRSRIDDPIEPAGVIDQHPRAFGEDRVVRGAPRHPGTDGDARHREVIDHERFQRPPQTSPGDLRPRLRSHRGVLPPETPAARALVTADTDQQRGRPMPERRMREPTSDRPSRHPLGITPATPRIRLDDPALDHRPTQLDPLPSRDESEFVEAAECVRSGVSKVA